MALFALLLILSMRQKEPINYNCSMLFFNIFRVIFSQPSIPKQNSFNQHSPPCACNVHNMQWTLSVWSHISVWSELVWANWSYCVKCEILKIVPSPWPSTWGHQHWMTGAPPLGQYTISVWSESVKLNWSYCVNCAILKIACDLDLWPRVTSIERDMPHL